jgi:hypothetical protein
VFLAHFAFSVMRGAAARFPDLRTMSSTPLGISTVSRRIRLMSVASPLDVEVLLPVTMPRAWSTRQLTRPSLSWSSNMCGRRWLLPNTRVHQPPPSPVPGRAPELVDSESLRKPCSIAMALAVNCLRSADILRHPGSVDQTPAAPRYPFESPDKRS